MPPKLRELKARLRRAGFIDRRSRGSHTVWTHPLIPEESVTLSGNDGKDAKPYQESDVRDALRALDEVRKDKP